MPNHASTARLLAQVVEEGICARRVQQRCDECGQRGLVRFVDA